MAAPLLSTFAMKFISRFLCVSLLMLGVLPAMAGITESITPPNRIRTSNYNAMVVAADAVTGHMPDRSKIKGEWTMDFTWDGLDTIGADYESTIWFEDDSGNHVPIIPDGSSTAVTAYVEEYQVSLNSMATTDSHTFDITFKPQNQLSPHKRYTLKAKWRKKLPGNSYGGIYFGVLLNDSSPNTALYFHFPNTTSGDAGANAQSVVDIDSWNRRWMIAGSPTQGSLRFLANVTTYRFDDYDLPISHQAIVTTLSVALKKVSTGAVVWTAPDKHISITVASHSIGSGALAEHASNNGQAVVDLNVPPGILEQGQSYAPVITVTHTGETTGGNDGTRAFAAQSLLRFSGRVFFGSFETTFDAVDNDPASDLNAAALPLPTTTLAVPVGHGFLPDAPGVTYGGTPLAVEIEPDGDALYGDGTLISLSGADSVTTNGVTIQRSDVTLNMSGAKAGSLTIRLPRGFGWSPVPATRVLKSKMTATNITLGSDLLPTSSLFATAPGGIFLALDRLPLVFAAPSLSFDFNVSRFLFTPSSCLFDSAFELATLENYGATSQIEWSPLAPLHAGNDQVFRAAKVSGTDQFVVSAGSDQAVHINSARLEFNAGAFWTHFPKHWLTVTSGGQTANSQFVITNDVVTESSVLDGIAAVFGSFSPNCKEEENKPICPLGLATASAVAFAANVSGDQLSFLPDGSLHGSAALFSTVPAANISTMAWGTISTGGFPLFAHHITLTTGAAITGNLLLPAHFLSSREAATAAIAMDDRTAASHLTGRSVGLVEAPYTAGYHAGAADYAGVNVRAGDFAGNLDGGSRIGGAPMVSYDLLPEAKFYFRTAGVSGSLQSSTNLGPMPINGFDMSFDGMKLAFLDNTVEGTKLNGGVSVGGVAPTYPCLFNVSFKNMRLFGNGALDRSDVDPNQGSKSLAYWRSEFTPFTLSFVQPDACAGPGSTSFLALGVKMALPALTAETQLSGVLGFRGDGTLVARDDADNTFAVTGIDSRLRVPGGIDLQGPGSSSYEVTPVSGAYLNKWPGSGVSPTTGYASIAGAVDVPFFENLTTHLHAIAPLTMDQKPTVHVMQPPVGLGPFDLADFDPTNSGVPSGVTLEDYHTLSNYFPHARKNWLGLIDFDYPMEWNRALRQFEMKPGADSPQNLKIAQAKSRVRSLTPSTADLKFKADLGIDLPSLNTNQLLGEALEGVGGGLLSALSGAVPGFGSVISELEEFEQCLADTPERLVRQPLIQAVANVRGTLGNPNAADFKTALINRLNAEFSATSASLVPPESLPSKWRESVFQKLNKADHVATTLRDYALDAAVIRDLANVAGGALGGNTGNTTVPKEVNEMLDNAYGLLTLVHNGISDVKTGINAITLTPDWAPIVDLALPELPANPLAGQTDEQVADILLKHFLGDASAALLGSEMRVHLSPMRDQLRSSFDQVFGGMNEMIQGPGGDVSPVPVPGVSLLSDLQFGKLDGYARINGDSLHELRLDADVRLELGTRFDFHGYALFRDLTSDTPDGGCRTGSGVAAELTLGASTTIPLGTPKKDTTLEVEAKFAFTETRVLNGLAGRFGLAGGEGFKLGVITITQAELGFGFGGGDGYLYGKGAGKSDYADVEAALFIGRTCGEQLLSTLSRLDAQAAELLAEPVMQPVINPTPANPNPIYGFYAFGYGAVSINALIGIPPSCMLNLKAGAGMGAFYFVRQHSFDSEWEATLGLRQDFGVSGEVLCVADISARLSLIGATIPGTVSSPINVLDAIGSASGITGNGKADFEVTIGVDPFDVTFSKTLKMNFGYSPLRFDVDF